MSDEAHREFAGVLLQSGQSDRALALVQQGGQTPRDLRFLASIHSSQRRFSDAMEIYRQLLQATPSDVEAQQGWPTMPSGQSNITWRPTNMANCSSTLRKTSICRSDMRNRCCTIGNTNRPWQRWMASCSASRRIWICGTDSSRPRRAVQLNSTDRERLEQIYRQQSLHDDERLQTSLLNAVSKHGDAAQVVPLLKALLLRKPDDATLRLRLADALHNLGRYTEAGVHFRWLLDHPAAVPELASPLTSDAERLP